MKYRSFFNYQILALDTQLPTPTDFDFITRDLFHQPTLDENDIAERLRIEPFFEGATHAR